MNHPSLQDGSAGDPNASSQSQILSHIKRLLKETQVCLDALDQSTLGSLRSDEEYKDGVGKLLAPLTTIPLSNIIQKALTGGVEAVTAQLGSLLQLSLADSVQDGKDAAGPSAILATAGMTPLSPDATKKQRDPSRYQTIVAPWKRGKNTSISQIQQAQQPQRSGFGVPGAHPPSADTVPQLHQTGLMMMMETNPLQDIRRNRRMMATIYFIKGGKKEGTTMPYLVEEANKTTTVIAAGGVSYAWETIRGEIVIAFRVPQTLVQNRRQTAESMLAQFSHLWTMDSSAYLRFGGDNPIYVLELDVISGGKHQFDWPTMVKEIGEELAGIHGGPSNSMNLLLLKEATWSKRWMLCDGYGTDIQKLVAEKWPRSHKKMVRYASFDVEIEISMHLLFIADRFDFRA